MLQISLAAARVNAGLTQDEVSKKMRISKQTLVRWEKGLSQPKVSQARQLGELYNIPLNNLLFYPGNPIKFDFL